MDFSLSGNEIFMFIILSSLILILPASAGISQTTPVSSAQIILVDNATNSPVPGSIIIKNSAGDVIIDTPTTNAGSVFVSNLVAGENYTIYARGYVHQPATAAFIAGDGYPVTITIPLVSAIQHVPVTIAREQGAPHTTPPEPPVKLYFIIAIVLAGGIIGYILIFRKERNTG